MSLRLYVLLAAGLAAACGPASGEEDAAAITEEVEVRSTLPSEDDVAAFATRLDTTAIAERGQDLADVLRRVPGARVHDYGGLGSYATMSLRASTSEQVTILVDGVPQNRALGGPVDLSSIPATQVADVTVFRGFGPAVYGLGGVGGVVDVRTRPPGEEPQVNLDVLAGELGTVRASADVSFRAGDTGRFRLGAELLRSTGDFTYLDTGETLFNPDDDAIRRRTNNDVDDVSALLQYVREGLGGGQLRIATRAQNRARGIPGLGTTSSNTARSDDSLNDLTTNWTRRFAGAVQALDLSADGFVQKISLLGPEGELGSGALDQTTTLDGGGTTGLVHAQLGRQRALVRVDLRRERAAVENRALEMPDRGGAIRTMAAVTLEDLIPWRRLTVAPSLRWEHRTDDFVGGGSAAVPPPAADVRDDAWSGKVGLAWAIGSEAALRGSVGRFYRSPNFLELFGDRGSIRGNPSLRPEKGLAAEIGYSIREGPTRRWSSEIVAFARKSEDLIHFLPVAQGAAVARNIAEVDTYGLETSVSLRLASAWTMDLTGTLQQATDVSGGFSDGRPIPYQPDVLGYFGTAYHRGRMSARWEVTYTGANGTDALDSPEFRLPARVIHDGSIGWDLPRGLRAGIDVRNLFDRRTRDLLRYPLPGRVVSVHLGWSSRPEGEKH